MNDVMEQSGCIAAIEKKIESLIEMMIQVLERLLSQSSKPEDALKPKKTPPTSKPRRSPTVERESNGVEEDVNGYEDNDDDEA